MWYYVETHVSGKSRADLEQGTYFPHIYKQLWLRFHEFPDKSEEVLFFPFLNLLDIFISSESKENEFPKSWGYFYSFIFRKDEQNMQQKNFIPHNGCTSV